MYAQEEKVLFLITYNRRIILPLLLHVGAAKFYHVCVYLEHLLLQGDCWTYRTQLEAAEMLTMLKPGLGYNMQHLTWNDAAGDAAKHISKAEESESIAHALQATQGPQQLLDLLEGCDLARYFCQRVPDMPDVHAFLQELPCHAFCAKLILAVWRDDQGDWKVRICQLSLPSLVCI